MHIIAAKESLKDRYSHFREFEPESTGVAFIIFRKAETSEECQHLFKDIQKGRPSPEKMKQNNRYAFSLFSFHFTLCLFLIIVFLSTLLFLFSSSVYLHLLQ